MLDLGCGVSNFFEQLSGDGYKGGQWVGVDFSAEAVKDMSDRLPPKAHPHIKFVKADVRAIPYPDHSFDLIVDKAADLSSV